MRSDVHHDDRLLTLFRLRRGLLRLRGLRFRRRLRLWSGGRLLNRLLHMLNGLLRMLNGLRLYRLLRRHGALADHLQLRHRVRTLQIGRDK